jgi:hypothetical protein
MSIKVIAMATDYENNVTQVTIQITENVGRIVRIKDTLTVPLPGRFEQINEPMMEALFAELGAHGLDPFPEAAA